MVKLVDESPFAGVLPSPGILTPLGLLAWRWFATCDDSPTLSLTRVVEVEGRARGLRSLRRLPVEAADTRAALVGARRARGGAR